MSETTEGLNNWRSVSVPDIKDRPPLPRNLPEGLFNRPIAVKASPETASLADSFFGQSVKVGKDLYFDEITERNKFFSDHSELIVLHGKTRKSERKTTRLSSKGREYLKQRFSSFIVLDGEDEWGYLDRHHFNRLISSIKKTYETTSWDKRTPEQKFNSLAVRSLEKMAQNFEDKDAEGFLTASNGPWNGLVDTLQQKTSDKNGKPKYSKEFIRQMIKPTAKTVLRETAKAVNDPLNEKYIAGLIAQRMSNKEAVASWQIGLAEDELNISREIKKYAINSLGGKALQIDEPSQLDDVLISNCRQSAIKIGALAQIEAAIDAYIDPDAKVTVVLADAQHFGKFLMEAARAENPEDMELYDIPENIDTLQGISELNETIKQIKRLSSPNERIMKVSQILEDVYRKNSREVLFRDSVEGDLAANLQILMNIRSEFELTDNPHTMARHLMRMHRVMGYTQTEALSEVLKQPWVANDPELLKKFENKYGESLFRDAQRHFSFFDKRLLKRVENKLGRQIRSVEDLPLEAGCPKEFKKLKERIDKALRWEDENISYGLFSFNKGRLSKTLNFLKLTSYLAPALSGAHWLGNQVAERTVDSLHMAKIDAAMINIDTTGDGVADKQISVGDFSSGLVSSTTTPTPGVTPTAVTIEHESAPVTVYGIDFDGDGRVDLDRDQIRQVASVQEAVGEHIEYLEGQVDYRQLFSVIADPFNQAEHIRMDQMSEADKARFHEEFVNNPHVLHFILVGKDLAREDDPSTPNINESVDDVEYSRGDANVGVIIDTSTGKVILTSLNRDLRVPNICSTNGCGQPINTAWGMGEDGKFRDPEFARQIFEEATGVPVDAVIEFNMSAFKEMMIAVNGGNRVAYVHHGDTMVGRQRNLDGMIFEDGQTYEMNVDQYLAVLRQRKGGTESTETRQVRQVEAVEFLMRQKMETLVEPIMNADNFIDQGKAAVSAFTEFIDMLHRLEEVAAKHEVGEGHKGIRMTSSLTPGIINDEDKNGQIDFYELIRHERGRLMDFLFNPNNVKEMVKLALKTKNGEKPFTFNQFTPNLVGSPDAGPLELGKQEAVLKDKEGNPLPETKFTLGGAANNDNVWKRDRALPYWHALRNHVKEMVLGKAGDGAAATN